MWFVDQFCWNSRLFHNLLYLLCIVVNWWCISLGLRLLIICLEPRSDPQIQDKNILMSKLITLRYYVWIINCNLKISFCIEMMLLMFLSVIINNMKKDILYLLIPFMFWHITISKVTSSIPYENKDKVFLLIEHWNGWAILNNILHKFISRVME